LGAAPTCSLGRKGQEPGEDYPRHAVRGRTTEYNLREVRGEEARDHHRKENTMQSRAIILALVFGCSLLLAPRAFAQQELIDPQPEPGAERQPLPSSPTA